MRTLKFAYDLRLDFARPVRRHAFQLRCLPRERGGQHIRQLQCRILPDVPVSTGTDGFGNTVCFGMAEKEHTSFSVSVSGIAELDTPALPDSELNAARYRMQTEFTKPGKAIRALYDKAQKSGDPMTRALSLMRIVRAEVAYVPASTTIATTAEQAAEQKCGVCQDHTQIMLSLLRMDGIPARYAAGLLLGEGRTHAWAEAWIDGKWVGLDATNGMVVKDTHIMIAAGRDHADCDLNRGVMLGFGGQTQTVHVSVREYET